MFINCVENCIHQNDGICNLEQVGPLTNTTSVGCEFYVKKVPAISRAIFDSTLENL